MTPTLRPNWPDAFGPGDHRMPNDPPPTMVDWNHAYEQGLAATHEDSIDRLNPNRTWGTLNQAEPGGSGIAFGYSSSDMDAVLVAEKAQRANPVQPDLEHHIRRLRYPIAAWEMTHDTFYARRIVALDSIATGHFTDDPATIHLGDPGWRPDTLAQYHAMANEESNVGLPWNGRAVGWTAYGRAMRHKCDRTVTTAWADMLLETCEAAAIPQTGQVIVDTRQGINESNICYVMHQMILVHGILCLCWRLHRSVPYWVLDWMRQVEDLPAFPYYGAQSMTAFVRSSDGLLLPATGPGQQGDPAFGWWSTNCVALWRLTNNPAWIERAKRWGPTGADSEQDRKFSMLLRGAV